MLRGCDCENKFVQDFSKWIDLCPTCGGASDWMANEASNETRAHFENMQSFMVAAKPPIVPTNYVRQTAATIAGEQLKTHELCGWTQPDGWKFCANCGACLTVGCPECGVPDGDVHKADCKYLARMKAENPIYGPSPLSKIFPAWKMVQDLKKQSLSQAIKMIGEETNSILPRSHREDFADRFAEFHNSLPDPSEDDTDDDIPVPIIVEKPK